LIFLAFLTNIAHALRYGSFDDVADERDPNGRGCVFDRNKPWPALVSYDMMVQLNMLTNDRKF